MQGITQERPGSTGKKTMETKRQTSVMQTGAGADPAECSRVDAVRLDIMRLVFRGALRIGDTLPSERALVGLFGLSRGSIRRILIRLCEDGVVRISHGKGTVVTGAPLWRAMPLPCRSERRRPSPAPAPHAAVAERLNLLIDMLAGCDHVPQFVLADHSFCAELAAACDAESAHRIRELAERLVTPGHREALEQPATRHEIVEGYRAISEAIERGDVGAASAAACGELQRRAFVPLAKTDTGFGDEDLSALMPMLAMETDLQRVLATWPR